MLLFRAKLRVQAFLNEKNLFHQRTFCTLKDNYIYEKREDLYSKFPNYPPVEPVGEDYERLMKMKTWHDKIKRQKTVEEKLFEINMPRYWGWKCLLLKEGEIPYNSLHFMKFITRTHVIETDTLPNFHNISSEKCFHLASNISKSIQNMLVDNIINRRPMGTNKNLDKDDEEKELTKIIVNDLNRLILKFLKNEYKNMSFLQTDYSPRLESFWNLGSLKETYVPEKFPQGLKGKMPEEYIGRPSDKYIQYIGKPIIHLRSENPLPPAIDHKDAVYFQYPLAQYNYDPFYVFGSEMVRRHVTNIPGFWPGDSKEFSFLSYHDINHLKYRPFTSDTSDAYETMKCHAILASFSWLMSLSSYQGFTSFHDITYPFVTQTILTDGQNFSFATYQLNTTELYHEDHFFNPRSNICWITPPVKLFDIEDGEVKALQIDVIKMLLQMYLAQTEALDKCERKPYLGNDFITVAGYEDDEKRCWLEQKFKYFSSNRPKHRVDKMYEPLDYERIFKIQFYRISRDSRKRPFELGEDPYLRRMDETVGEYIPRALRPDKDLPKYKQRKFKKTYYPE